jgi:hypothetical protein
MLMFGSVRAIVRWPANGTSAVQRIATELLRWKILSRRRQVVAYSAGQWWSLRYTRFMELPNPTKHTIFISVSAVCIIASVYLYLSGIHSFYFFFILALLTIITPIGTSMFVYKGRLAKLTMLLACIAMLVALVLAVDGLATRQTFKNTCQSIGSSHEFMNLGEQYACTAPSEQDYLYSNTFSGPLTGVIFWPYVLIIFASIANILYLPVNVARSHLRK